MLRKTMILRKPTLAKILTWLFAFLLLSNLAPAAPKTEAVSVEAPFDMPDIRIPDFSGCPQFSISEFGAIQGDKAATTQAIAKAIEQANVAGGGRVVIPAGNWLTGKIHLKSNVNLHVEKGATLTFSSEPADYLPAVKTTWEGMECYNYSPLIYAYNCRNVAITGEGKLFAKLDTWKDWYERPPAHMEASINLYNMAARNVPVNERIMIHDNANMRPQFIQFNRCQHVLLEGISIENSPFWVIHPFLSRDVVIRKVSVRAHGHNNDGVDPEMSQNVLIEDCVFDQGDDAIAVKAGRNHDAWRLNTPCKNIVVRNCLIKRGHQLLAIGSELSGGIENVLVENCHLSKDISDVRHIAYIKTNERRGGYVKNIYVRNVTTGVIKFGILGIETDVLYQWRDLVPTYERRLTRISDVLIEDVQVNRAKYVARIDGQEELPIQKITLKGISIDTVEEMDVWTRNVINFQLLQ